jgi:hypothetical protein
MTARPRSRRRAGRRTRRPARPPSAAARLFEAERLFQDFRALTPYRFKPFARSFDSWADYERWRRAQTNPWYR